MIFTAKLANPIAITIDTSVLQVPFSFESQLLVYKNKTFVPSFLNIRQNFPCELLSLAITTNYGIITTGTPSIEITGRKSNGVTVLDGWKYLLSNSPSESAIGQNMATLTDEQYAIVWAKCSNALSMVGIPASLNGGTCTIDIVAKIDIDERAVVWQ